MLRSRPRAVALLLLGLWILLPGCDDDGNLPFVDAAPPDAAAVEAGSDGAPPDAGPDRAVIDGPTADQRGLDQTLADGPAADRTVPDQMIPDQLVPDQMLSDQLVPDQMLPDQLVPDQMLPDQKIPDQLVPDQMLPDAWAPGCLSGGAVLSPSGSGSCADPYLLDLSALSTGQVVAVQVAGTVGKDESQFSYPSYGGCTPAPTTTARDVVFALTLPQSGISGVLMSVDGAAGADPIAQVLEDRSCGQPANACANNGPMGQCEFLLAPKGGTGFFGYRPYAVASEVVSSGKALTVRFSLVP